MAIKKLYYVAGMLIAGCLATTALVANLPRQALSTTFAVRSHTSPLAPMTLRSVDYEVYGKVRMGVLRIRLGMHV